MQRELTQKELFMMMSLIYLSFMAPYKHSYRIVKYGDTNDTLKYIQQQCRDAHKWVEIFKKLDFQKKRDWLLNELSTYCPLENLFKDADTIVENFNDIKHEYLKVDMLLSGMNSALFAIEDQIPIEYEEFSEYVENLAKEFEES